MIKFKDIDKIKVAISISIFEITSDWTRKNYRISIGAKFKLAFCAKSDRGLDIGFWEILKSLKCTNITSFFLIKTNG
jgi:hypothetical protein